MKYNGIELKPITEVQAFDEPREMLVWNDDTKPTILSVLAFCVWGETVRPLIDSGSTQPIMWGYAAEIPKPKTRKMTSLEVMEYLNKLQLWCNTSEKEDYFLKNKIELPVFEDGLHNKKLGVVVLNMGDKYGWEKPTGEFLIKKYPKFGILKNGKVTEFELPEVEEKE